MRAAGKRALCTAASAFVILVNGMGQVTAFAGNTNIVVDNQTGDDSIEVEVSVGGVPCILSADTGFRYNLDAVPDIVEVDARVSGDIYGYYDLAYEPEADLQDGGIIRITVSYSSQFGDEGIEDAPDLNGAGESNIWDPAMYDDGLPDTGMEEFDLSDGAAETGTLVIQCQPVNAFDEAVLTIVDEDYKTYQIPLHMEPYFFRAKVKLPAGKYRESGAPAITFNESASKDTSLSYVWAQTGGAAFGGFFDIHAGEETPMKDLAIRTVRDGEITDTDSRYYFNKKTYEEESKAVQKSDAEFQKKNYPDLSLEIQEPSDDDSLYTNPGIWEKIVMTAAALVKVLIPLALVAVLGIGVRALHKKYKDNNRMY